MIVINLLLIALTSHAETSDNNWKVYKPEITKGAPLEAYCLEPGQENGLVTKGDFDGNGKLDTAKLEENKARDKRRLVVYFEDKPTPYIVEEKSTRYSGNFLKTVKSKDTKSQISYGSCEASEVILTWDAKSKKFKENWISD